MIHKKLLSLLVLLMTAASGAWATVYSSGEVYTTDLKVGDVIIYGASIHNKFKLAANRYKLDGSVQTGNSYEFQNMGLGTNGSLSGGYTPVTADGQDGNAWVVLSLKAENSDYVMLGGINYTPEGIYPATDAQKEGDPFTEATFAMPASDATVDYELVRDMGVSMPVTVGDGTDGADYRVRLKKDGSKWELADLTDISELFAVIKVHDAIENKDLAFSGTEAVCSLGLYALDDQDEPTGAAISDYTTLVPGRYAVIATAADGTAYDGTTDQSNAIVLFQGYEVTVPSKEFVTYYKDEPLYADTEDGENAQLYTITSVSGDKAVLSSAITTAPSNTPLLIYNPTGETKKFLLIPATAEPNLALTVYDGFTGTLTGETIAASTTTQNNYAFNGKNFVWVMNDLEIGANKAWLSISATSGARVINLVFDDATRIDGVARTAEQSGDYYDLNGRKLAAKPTRKGVYIQNGRKVVIK